MKIFTPILFIFVIAISLWGYDNEPLTIGFWNVENLFDLEDDPLTNDEEFTPSGKKHVTQEILHLKLDHLSEVLSDLNVDIIGLAEVENQPILEMLNNRFKERSYSIIHYDSPDRRGIDTALLYDRNRFKVIISKPIPIHLNNDKKTRDILYVKGIFEGIELNIFVNHWPSHWGGTEKTIPLRAIAAQTLRKEVDNILNMNATAEIIIMGDLNDQPSAPSVSHHLGSSLIADSISIGKPALWNLMAPFINKPNGGSYKYRGKDLVFDQIIVSSGLADNVGLSLVPESIQIISNQKYRQQTGDYAGYPFRFWAGNRLLGGYSDHLAIKVSIGRY